MKFRGFDWDSGNTEKCQKHGVSMLEIQRVFLDGSTWMMPDIAHSDEEERIVAINQINGRYIFVVFTERRGLIRPVSARYMHKKEVEYYGKEKDA